MSRRPIESVTQPDDKHLHWKAETGSWRGEVKPSGEVRTDPDQP